MSDAPLSQLPSVTHPKNDGTAAVTEMDQRADLLEFDKVAIAQSSAPQVVARVTELENCMWALAEELIRFDPRNPQIERAKLLLKNRLEIFESSEYIRQLKPAGEDYPGQAYFHTHNAAIKRAEENHR
jgi:hypothetical protein